MATTYTNKRRVSVSMAKKRPSRTSFERFVVSPSLLQGITIHPTSPRFSIGMEEWIDSYMENVYPTRRINERFKYATETEARQTSASSSAASSLHPLASRATYFEHAPNQPHPECIEPPPKKQKRFQTLSCEELDKLSTPYIPTLVCFNNCQVSINYNNGHPAPVTFTSHNS